MASPDRRETWHLTRESDRVTLRARAEGDGRMIGDARSEVLPGETVAGLDYDGWRALPEGPVVVTRENGRPVRVEPAPTDSRP